MEKEKEISEEVKEGEYIENNIHKMQEIEIKFPNLLPIPEEVDPRITYWNKNEAGEIPDNNYKAEVTQNHIRMSSLLSEVRRNQFIILRAIQELGKGTKTMAESMDESLEDHHEKISKQLDPKQLFEPIITEYNNKKEKYLPKVKKGINYIKKFIISNIIVILVYIAGVLTNKYLLNGRFY